MCHGNHSNTLPWHDNEKGDRNTHDQGKLIVKKLSVQRKIYNSVSFRVLQYQPDTCSCSPPTGATEMRRNFHNQRYLTLYTLNYSLTVASLASIYIVYSHTISVFSLAYLRHVGPTSLHYRIPFDVGIGTIHMLWCDHGLHPPIMPWI